MRCGAGCGHRLPPHSTPAEFRRGGGEGSSRCAPRPLAPLAAQRRAGCLGPGAGTSAWGCLTGGVARFMAEGVVLVKVMPMDLPAFSKIMTIARHPDSKSTNRTKKPDLHGILTMSQQCVCRTRSL